MGNKLSGQFAFSRDIILQDENSELILAVDGFINGNIFLNSGFLSLDDI